MKTSIARSLAVALAIAGATATTLEGASSRIALSGGRLASEPVSVLALSSPASIRPLQPGEMLVLGPTAGPLTAPAVPAPALAPAPTNGAAAPPVDTVTVTAPGSKPVAAPLPARTWEGYRTGNVVRIDLR